MDGQHEASLDIDAPLRRPPAPTDPAQPPHCGGSGSPGTSPADFEPHRLEGVGAGQGKARWGIVGGGGKAAEKVHAGGFGSLCEQKKKQGMARSITALDQM